LKNKTAPEAHYAARKHPKIGVTENQLKVIKDKYLRNSHSIEGWLDGVAHNIALAEILAHPTAEDWGSFPECATAPIRWTLRARCGPRGCSCSMTAWPNPVCARPTSPA